MTHQIDCLSDRMSTKTHTILANAHMHWSPKLALAHSQYKNSPISIEKYEIGLIGSLFDRKLPLSVFIV